MGVGGCWEEEEAEDTKEDFNVRKNDKIRRTKNRESVWE